MPLSSDPRGVCILRVAQQSTGMLLTVVARADVEASGSQVETITLEVEEALAEVCHFVERFIELHPPSEGAHVADLRSADAKVTRR